MTFQTIRRACNAHPLILLFAVALLLRLGFLCLTLSQIPPEQLNSLTPDWTAYVTAAQELLTNGTLNSVTVTTYGPGYPVFLYLIAIVTGWQPVFALIMQIVLSSLCAVGIYLLAMQLLHDKRIALLAGYLYACNLLSISLSAGFFSETVFVAALLGGLLLLFHGLREQKFVLFIAASILVTIAILIRAQGLFLPLLILLWLPFYRWFKHDVLPAAGTGKRIVVFVLLCYTLVGSWTLHNMVAYEMPLVSRALPGSLEKVGMFITMKENNSDWQTEKASFDSLLNEQVQKTGEPMYKIYTGFAADYFFHAFSSAPLQATWILCKLSFENMHLETGHLQVQLPEWAESVKRAESISNKKAFNYRASIFSLIGFVLLWRSRRKTAAVILASLYCYFAVLATFTVWQGNRIMYPAVIAWSILIAVALVWGCDHIRAWFRQRRSPAFTHTQ